MFLSRKLRGALTKKEERLFIARAPLCSISTFQLTTYVMSLKVEAREGNFAFTLAFVFSGYCY